MKKNTSVVHKLSRLALLLTATYFGIAHVQAADVELTRDTPTYTNGNPTYPCRNYVSLSTVGSYFTYAEIQERQLNSFELFETDYIFELDNVAYATFPGQLFDISFNVTISSGNNGRDTRCIDHGGEADDTPWAASTNIISCPP